MSALRGYADGGLVTAISRRMPYIPPMPDAGGGMAGAGGSTLNLSLDGQSYSLQGTQDTIAALAKAVRTRKLQRR